MRATRTHEHAVIEPQVYTVDLDESLLERGSDFEERLKPLDKPRLTEMQGLTSQEGAPIPRLYGRARLGGQLIWATRFEEVVNTVNGVKIIRSIVL